MITSRIIFLEKFISEPRKIGSITPSSSFLTETMLANLPWDKIETVVELGAGNGVFTKFIADNKKETCRALIIEQNSEMRRALETEFSTFYYGKEAEKADRLLRQYDLPQADCVISGLPFAAFSQALRNEVIGAVIRSLKQEGIFVAFQYSPQMQKILKKHFDEVKIKFVPLNLPPAFVYYCKKFNGEI